MTYWIAHRVLNVNAERLTNANLTNNVKKSRSYNRLVKRLDVVVDDGPLNCEEVILISLVSRSII